MSKFLLVFCLFVSQFALANLKIGLVLDKGGKDDKSFNSAAYEGAKKAEKELGIELKYVEATDTNSLETLHRNFAQKNMIWLSVSVLRKWTPLKKQRLYFQIQNLRL